LWKYPEGRLFLREHEMVEVGTVPALPSQAWIIGHYPSWLSEGTENCCSENKEFPTKIRDRCSAN
jgi:hypothetical protein